MTSDDTDRSTRVQRSRIARLLLAVLVVVPLAFAALYMWVMWDPSKTVKDMPVAIVNADQPVGAGETEIHAGEDVTSNLLDSKALAFENADAATALDGLRRGHYYFVINIPKDFSATLAGIGDATVAPALISVTYNDNNTLKASSIGAAAMAAINAAVLKGVSTTTVGTVLDGVQSLSAGLDDAAAGSNRLHDGTVQLRTGSDQLAEGLVSQLVPGVAAAARGAESVEDGAGRLSAGLVQLQSGTDRLGAGATQVADGIDSLVGAVDIDALTLGIDQIKKVAPDVDLSQITTLLNGLTRLQTGSRQIATELTDPSAQYRSGVDELVDGSGTLASGTTQLTDGLHKLDTGTAQAADGAVRLRDGIHEVDDGAGQLDDGLAAGAEQAPDLGDRTKRESLAALVSTPVSSTSDNLASAQNLGPGAAPTMLIFAVGIGVIAVFMSFRGHRYISGHDEPPTIRTVLRRAVAVGGVSLGVMGAVGGALWFVLTPTPTPASVWEVVGICAAATLMTVTVVSVLFTLFGYVAGALTSLAALMLQIFAYGGIWMVETLPAPLRMLHPISPLTYVRDGLISAFNGTPGFGRALAAIVIIGAVAAAVNLAAVSVARRRFDSRSESTEQPQPV